MNKKTIEKVEAIIRSWKTTKRPLIYIMSTVRMIFLLALMNDANNWPHQ